MDDQNQKPEPQQSITPQQDNPSPSIGGQKVIQPTEAILEHLKSQPSVMPTQAPHVIQPPSFDPSKTAPVPPSATPAAITPASQPENSPAQFANPAGPSAVVGGALVEAASTGKHQGSRNKILLIVVGSIVLLVAIAAVLFVTLHKTNNKKANVATTKTNSATSVSAAPPGFKTVTYDNGVGSSFQLLFYSNYSITDGVSTKQLVSNVAKNGLYPLQLSIAAGSNSNSIDSQLITTETNCFSGASPDNPNDTLHIKNTFTGNTVNMCGLEGEDNSTSINSYVGVLKAGSNYFGISISQNELGSTTLVSNLQAYNSDIKTIVSSIKVVSGKTPSQPNSSPSASQESKNVFTASGLLEPTDIGETECTVASVSNTSVSQVAVSGSASCNDAQNVVSDATAGLNGGNFSGFGYKCTSVKDGAGYKYASHWQAEWSNFYSYTCVNGSNQIAFNWQNTQNQ